MTLEEAIDRVQKLLRLSKSDNPNEAATALAQAQRLLDKYGIEEAMLEDGQVEKVEPVSKDVIEETSAFNLDSWKSILANLIADVNSCRAVVHCTRINRTIAIYGRPSDAAKVRYLYSFFVNEVQRLCDRDAKGQGRTFRNSFRHGVVETLAEALLAASRESRAEACTTDKGTRALARIDNHLTRVDEFLKPMKLKMGNNISPLDMDARLMGRLAGQEVTLTQARGALK